MVLRSADFGTRAHTKLLLGLLCIALVLVTGTVSVTHLHAGSPVSDSGCSLCAAAHVVIQVAPGLTIQAAAVSVTRLHTPCRLLPQRSASVFALFTRPPPTPSSLS